MANNGKRIQVAHCEQCGFSLVYPVDVWIEMTEAEKTAVIEKQRQLVHCEHGRKAEKVKR